MNETDAHKQVALIIDDEVQMRRLLKITLESNGYRVLEAANGQDGLTEAATRKPDVVIIDMGLPDMDGIAVLKRLREWSQVPVVVLTVRDREEDKIAALDSGADDYVTKPFSTGELLARLRVAQRHTQSTAESILVNTGEISVDLATRRVTRKGQEIKLTATEYSLLKLLARHCGKVLTHDHILREVWGPTYVGQTHYLRVYVAHLREKLEAIPSKPEILITEPGVGYRLIQKD